MCAIHVLFCPRVRISLRVASLLALFRYMVTENRKCTNPKDLIVKTTPVYINYSPPPPAETNKIDPFHCTTRRVQDITYFIITHLPP